MLLLCQLYNYCIDSVDITITANYTVAIAVLIICRNEIKKSDILTDID